MKTFEETWNALTVEINRVGPTKATEILRANPPEPETQADYLVMYIMRHFVDAEHDPRTLRNRAEAAVADYKEHVKRNGPGIGIEGMLLDENIPEADFSRPTRGFFNTAVTEAFYRGKKSKGTK